MVLSEENKRLTLCGTGAAVTYAILAINTFAFLAIAIISGPQYDYNAYLIEWHDVLAGRDPWMLGRMSPGVPYNAYGPLFNAIAPLIYIHYLAPKILFVTAYLYFLFWVVRGRGMSLPIIFALLFPLTWEMVPYGGLLDTLVGITCAVAVDCHRRRDDIAAGAWLAAGILLKFMPIVVLPFLVFERGKFHVRTLAACAGIVAIGLAASLLIWGASTFNPMIFAVNRPEGSTIYEVMWHVNTVLDKLNFPIRLTRNGPDVSWAAQPILALAGLVVFTWCIAYRASAVTSSFIAVLLTVTLYQHGSLQYQMMAFGIAVYWAVENWMEIAKDTPLVVALAFYFSLLSVMVVGDWTGMPTTNLARELVILIKFLSASILLVMLMRLAVREGRQLVA